jgi:ferredoxin
VRVHEEVKKHGKIVDPGCMKCLDCVSVCPKEALYVGFAMPKPFAISQQRIQARADFTWPEEILLAVVAVYTTQWVWRRAWFGEGVPFLMAVGLGVITAVFALLFWRLLRRREVTFQHTVLKVAGRRNRSGRWVTVGLGAWLLFTAHTGVVQRYKASVVDQVFAASRSDATPEQLQAALADAETVHALDFVDDPFVNELRGLLLRRLGRHAEAEARLLAAHDAVGYMETPNGSLSLAAYCLDPTRQRYDLAEKLVRSVLAVLPEHPQAKRMLEAIEARPR